MQGNYNEALSYFKRALLNFEKVSDAKKNSRNKTEPWNCLHEEERILIQQLMSLMRALNFL